MSKKFSKHQFNDKVNNIKLYCDELCDNKKGLIITLSDEKESLRFKLKFPSHLGYRNFDEGDRLELMENYPIICGNHAFFLSDDSDWLDWYHIENMGKYEGRDKKILHFMIVTPNDIVEVLCEEMPVVEIIS